jgi:hypothetical protein
MDELYIPPGMIPTRWLYYSYQDPATLRRSCRAGLYGAKKIRGEWFVIKDQLPAKKIKPGPGPCWSRRSMITALARLRTNKARIASEMEYLEQMNAAMNNTSK